MKKSGWFSASTVIDCSGASIYLWRGGVFQTPTKDKVYFAIVCDKRNVGNDKSCKDVPGVAV
jgi:hypothetical protein